MSEPRPRTTHELKTWPEFFEATRCGRKKFELRRNDRNFQVGDELWLKEWNPGEGRKPGGDGVAHGYTGRGVVVRVDYIMKAEDITFGPGESFWKSPVAAGYVIMSISHVN